MLTWPRLNIPLVLKQFQHDLIVKGHIKNRGSVMARLPIVVLGRNTTVERGLLR